MPRRQPVIDMSYPITKELFDRIDAAVRARGYQAAIDRSEIAPAPTTAAELASEAIYVICNSGMSNIVAVPIFKRCMKAVRAGRSASTVFGHPGKADAIDWVWKHRRKLFREFTSAPDIIEFFAAMPWIGPITKFHAAKNVGADVAKPDVHLNRLADREGVSAQELCARLARETGYRVATIDLILWRACADGIIHSK